MEDCSTDGILNGHYMNQSASNSETAEQKIVSVEFPRKAFTPPTMEEVLLAGAKIMLPEIECQKFFFFYESKSWFVGKSKMQVWKAALSGWKLRWMERNSPHSPAVTQLSGADKIILERERGRIEERLLWIKRYYHDTPWSPSHLTESQRLKTRLTVVKNKLGVVL